MTLTDIERKCLMLAMDSGATEFEMAVAATKFVRALKTRFPSGHELLKVMESGIGPPQPGDVVFKTQAEANSAADAMNRGFGGVGGWNDILRQAQKFGRARAARQQDANTERQQTWEEFKKRMREEGMV